MGTSVSVQENFTNINQSVSNAISTSGKAVSEANCNIKIGTITFDSAINCNVKIKNNCSSDAQTAMDSILNVVQSTINNLDQVQRQQAAAALGTIVNVDTSKISNNIYQEFKNYVDQTCINNSTVNNNIAVENITYGKCIGLTSATIEFLNTGQAKANCIMKVLNQVNINAQNQLSQDQSSTSGLFGVLSDFVTGFKNYAVYAIIAVVIILLGAIISKVIMTTAGSSSSRQNFDGGSNRKKTPETIMIPAPPEPKNQADKDYRLKIESMKNEPMHWSLFSREFLQK